MMAYSKLLLYMALFPVVAGISCNAARSGKEAARKTLSDPVSRADKPETGLPASPDSQPEYDFSADRSSEKKFNAQDLIIRACDNYLAINPKSAKAPEVLSIKGGTYYNNRKYDAARTVYQTIIDSFPANVYAIDATKMMAQTYYEEKDFTKAEQWYRVLREIVHEGVDKDEAVTRIAEAAFRMAEAYEDQQRFGDAAAQFERVALEFSESKIADVALFNAGAAYEKLAEWSRAILMYHRLIQRYLKSPIIPKSMFRVAKCFEKLFQWDQAGQTYLRVIANYPQSELASASLYNAGICFENAEKLFEAAATFEKFAEMFPDSPDAADVLFKAGEIFGRLKDWQGVTRVNQEFSKRFGNDKDRVVQALCMVGVALYMQKKEDAALTRLEDAITTYTRLKAPSDVNKYYAAKAQFTIAEIYHDRMKNVELTQPENLYLSRLKNKSRILEQAVDAYSKVIKFAISEWTTRSIFSIALGYEDFAMGIFRQQRPSGMSVEKQVALELGIAQAVEEYFEDAVKYHEQNVKLAIREKIDNKYVLDSRRKIVHLPFMAGKNYLLLVDISESTEKAGNLSGFGLIARKFEILQKVAPFQERAIKLFYTCLEKGAMYEEYSDYYNQAKELITGISFIVGETYAEIAHIARKSPVPETFDEYERFVYKSKLIQQVQTYEDQALASFIRTIQIADAYTISDNNVNNARKRVARVLFFRGRSYDLLGISAFNNPPLPADISEEESEEYAARFEEIGLRFQDQAFGIYKNIVEYAGQNYAAGDYVVHAYVRLFQKYPEEYGMQQDILKPRIISSGPHWKCSGDSVPGWNTLEFDDNSWARAGKAPPVNMVELSGFPGKIPVPMWYGDESDRPDRLFFRFVFNSADIPPQSEFYLAAADKYEVYVNENLLPADQASSQEWFKARRWDLKDILNEGKNVFAVRVENSQKNVYGLFPFLRVMQTRKEYLPKPPGFEQPLELSYVSESTYTFPDVPNFSPVMENVVAVPDSTREQADGE